MRYAVAVLACLAPLAAAPWVSPDWGGAEPTFPPGSLDFKTNAYPVCPVLYRYVVNAGAGRIVAAPVTVRVQGYGYLWVNGRRAGQHAPTAATQRLDLDLRPWLQAGPNVMVLSTGAAGFSLDGEIRTTQGSVPLLSGQAWRVTKVAPLTLLDTLPVWRPEQALPHACAVAFSDGPAATRDDEHRATLAQQADAATAAALQDAAWRLDLLRTRGLCVLHDSATGFGGPRRLPDWVRETAAIPGGDRVALADAVCGYVRLNDQVTHLANLVTGLRALGQTARADFCQHEAQLGRAYLEAAEPLLRDGDAPAALPWTEQHHAWPARQPGAPPVGELDWAIDNKFAWSDTTRLLDNDPAAWGLRVNPLDVSWTLPLDGRWRFQLDPDNTGLAEQRQSFGYNIENQWPEISVPGAWEDQGFQQDNPHATEQSPYPGVNVRTDGPYNGFAWYRKTLQVPREWAGHDLELGLSMADDWDWGYFNGEPIGHTGADTKEWWLVPRRYRIPREKVQFGGTNVIAIRIYDCGAKGVLGHVELRCPALQAAAATHTTAAVRPTTVYASPLSPAALLTCGQPTLQLSGWDQRGLSGPRRLVCVVGGQVRTLTAGYQRERDGELSENWVLLAGDRGAGDDRPILLVCLQRPEAIALVPGLKGTGQVSVTFNRPLAQVLLLRPLAPGEADPAVCRFWSRAALAYPVSWSEAVAKDPREPGVLRVADVFNHRELHDAWGTVPLPVAPLAPLACYGLKSGYPGLRVESRTQPLPYPLGEWGTWQGVRDAHVIVWRVPREPLKRYGGFTCFAFSPADVGVPGNHKELELLAHCGATSFRPQHNQHGQAALDLLAWTNAAGLMHVFNVDNEVGKRDTIFEHYRELARACRDLPFDAVAYDLINEPANMTPEFYNPWVKRLTAAIREVDPTHLIYVETPHSFAAVNQFAHLQPTGDAHTVYSFHDYDYRQTPRWPSDRADVRSLLNQFLPAIRFAIDNRCAIHLGEFGGFEQTKEDIYGNPSALTLLADYFRIFDQFGWHWHYYSNRGTARVLADGSLQDSLVHEAHRQYFAQGTFNAWR